MCLYCLQVHFGGVGGLPLAARVAHLGSFVDAHFSENSINKRLFYVRTLVLRSYACKEHNASCLISVL